SRRRHTRFSRDWSSDVCSSDLEQSCAPPWDGQYNVWVEIDDTGESRRLARFPGSILKSIQPSPTGEHTIALVNVEGRQGLFEVGGNEDGFGLAPLVLCRDGSWCDLSWGPPGAS